jgi:hypothetical protein
MTRTRDEAKVAEAARLYLSGMTRQQVAREMRVNDSTVSRWLADVIRPRGPRPRADVRDALILSLKDREGLSFEAIGRRVHMSKTGARMRYYSLTGRERPDRAKA